MELKEIEEIVKEESIELQRIEEKLENLLNVEKKNWVEVYLLLKKVEDEKLWKLKEYNSFTQWVKDFAIRSKCHESNIWQKKKAGEVFLKLAKKQEERGEQPIQLTEAKVSVENLILLDKISKNSSDSARTDELIGQVFNKEITTRNLREIYRTVQPKSKKNTSELQEITNENNTEVLQEITKDKNKKNITINSNIESSDIVRVLSDSENWLGQKIQRRYFKSAYEQNKFSVFTEFPLFTGNTRHSRRVDMLCVENITTENIWELYIHGIEIKVSKSDLLNDTKYTEYYDFVDYLWLAIPKELEEVALKNVPTSVGILSICRNSKEDIKKKYKKRFDIKKVREAQKSEGMRKLDTFTSLTLKLM